MRDQDKHQNQGWIWYAMLALLAEKVIQHVFVTTAFFFNWGDISSTVAVSPTALMIAGAGLAVLFALALWAVAGRRPWATKLVVALALCDIVGEFIAQGTLLIGMNVSFAVATALLVLVLLGRGRVVRTA